MINQNSIQFSEHRFRYDLSTRCQTIADGGLGTVGTHISGYSVHMEKSGGLLVVDPTRCGVIKLAQVGY